MTSTSMHRDLGVFEVDGLLISAPRTELSVMNEDFETTTRHTLLTELSPGDVFLDVGAHVGTMALPASLRVGPTGHVHAVEPAPDTSRTLRHNVQTNAIENITVHECAAGARSSRARFHVMSTSHFNGLSAHPLGNELTTVDVNVRPLDEVVSGHVDAVKIDVEGGELAALRGMQQIARDNPYLMVCVEWNPATLRAAGEDPLTLIDALVELDLEPNHVIDEANGGQSRRVEDVWALLAFDLDTVWWGNVIAYGPARRGALAQGPAIRLAPRATGRVR